MQNLTSAWPIFKVPHWDEVLELAASCYDMSGLAILELISFLMIKEHLLELNARPGMAIQICNNAGLLPRLRLIEALSEKAAPKC